jgi:predicted secreted acid phosphatase
VKRLLALLVSLLVSLVVVLVPASSQARVQPAHGRAAVTAERTVPTKDQWLADVHRAMIGARKYVKERVASGDTQLAINFDIDNTVLETYYGGGAIPQMLKFTQFAQRHGVGVLFNTGRVASMHDSTLAQLTANGYVVDGLCLRNQGETLPHGKQRCRQQYVDAGWTLIENIGNRPTALAGGNYEKAFKLPDYGGVLG